MNEALKGFRTIIIGILAALLGQLDMINDAVQASFAVVDVALSDGGAVAALMATAMNIKMIWTDAIPKLRG